MTRKGYSPEQIIRKCGMRYHSWKRGFKEKHMGNAGFIIVLIALHTYYSESMTDGAPSPSR